MYSLPLYNNKSLLQLVKAHVETGRRRVKHYPGKNQQSIAQSHPIIEKRAACLYTRNLNEVLLKYHLLTLHCYLGPVECLTYRYQKVPSSNHGWILEFFSRIMFHSSLACFLSLYCYNHRLLAIY